MFRNNSARAVCIDCCILTGQWLHTRNLALLYSHSGFTDNYRERHMSVMAPEIHENSNVYLTINVGHIINE